MLRSERQRLRAALQLASAILPSASCAYSVPQYLVTLNRYFAGARDAQPSRHKLTLGTPCSGAATHPQC